MITNLGRLIYWVINNLDHLIDRFSFPNSFCRSFEPILRLLHTYHTPHVQLWATWALANLCTVSSKYFIHVQSVLPMSGWWYISSSGSCFWLYFIKVIETDMFGVVIESQIKFRVSDIYMYMVGSRVDFWNLFHHTNDLRAIAVQWTPVFKNLWNTFILLPKYMFDQFESKVYSSKFMKGRDRIFELWQLPCASVRIAWLHAYLQQVSESEGKSVCCTL